MKLNKLTEEEKRVIIDKETKAPFTGEYYKNKLNSSSINSTPSPRRTPVVEHSSLRGMD